MNPEEQPKRGFITVPQIIKEMGLEPTENLVRWVEAKMDAYIQARGEDPSFDAASPGLISVAQVVSDMGLEPTAELVSEVEQEMVKWFEHEFRDVAPIDDGGVSCYYRNGNIYQFREDLYRTKIEEIVQRISDRFRRNP
jgi:hypothetical protein